MLVQVSKMLSKSYELDETETRQCYFIYVAFKEEGVKLRKNSGVGEYRSLEAHPMIACYPASHNNW